MLITRICDTDYSPWTLPKYDSPARRPGSPRMSDRYGVPLPVQPDWQGQYSYLPQHDGDVFSRPFADSRHGADEPRRPQSPGEEAQSAGRAKSERGSPGGQRASGDSPGPRDAKLPSPAEDQAAYADKPQGDAYFPRPPSGPSHMRTVLAAEGPEPEPARPEGEARDAPVTADEGDVECDDDEALGPDGEASARPQTMEERLAARRKMKRFRLTHQQTRFLMSEFAKQPHPDAAHRERLSREIPGLSPRQVQVWFQNRRAKIKRLTADDRDRMIRMRAVPDGFDNVQALHSPYGAVHGLGGDGAVNPAPYGSHMLRPLMVDVRRHEDAYMSPTTLTPSFGGIELGQSDMVSPLSSVSSDNRYAALSASSRTPNPSLRQCQSMHMRESIPRSTPDSLQSPLRGSVSWKSDSLEYSPFQAPTSASSASAERPPPAYQIGSAPGSAVGGFESQPYNNGTEPPAAPTGLGYSGMPQPPSPSRTRTRASSASLPLSIDFRFRDSYRAGPGSGGPATSPPYAARASQLPPPASQQDASSIYSPGHLPAPHSAPLSLSPSRPFNGASVSAAPSSSTVAAANAESGTGASSSSTSSTANKTPEQISAPASAPGDFGRGFAGPVASQPSAAPSMKDYFGSTAF